MNATMQEAHHNRGLTQLAQDDNRKVISNLRGATRINRTHSENSGLISSTLNKTVVVNNL